MIKEFAKLTREEVDFLYKVPAIITIMIAGADDDIDDKERGRAEKLARYKKVSGEPELMPYYEEVDKNFEATLIDLLHEYPKSASERNPIISRQLEQLNIIFPKLSKDYSILLYKTFRSFAKNVAEASGGFLGFLSVGPEEKQWIDLPMVRDPREV